LALGDALGAAHEGGLLERLLWRVIGTTREGRIRWTDDTQMSLDVAESLIAKGDLDRRSCTEVRAQPPLEPGLWSEYLTATETSGARNALA
jgi:ADP-ribosylglycohydrolase